RELITAVRGRLVAAPVERPLQAAVVVGLDDCRVDVALAADRRRVAEHLGDRFDDVIDRLRARALVLRPGMAGQLACAGQRAAPGAVVLGGQLLATDLLEVRVHVVGLDQVALAVVVQVAEDLIAGELQALLDEPRQALIGHIDVLLDAALAAELKADRIALQVDVLRAQRRQPKRLVDARVLLVADADQRRLQEPDDASQHLLAGQAAHAQVVVGALADDRQDGGEVHQMVVLVSVADLAPALVVDVLLPAAVVPPGGLNVAGGVWADPDISPGRRNGQLLDPRAHLAVADRLAVRVAVAEATPSSPASDARALVGDVAQARGLRGLGSVRWRELAQRRVLLDACSDDWYTGRRSLPARAQIVYMPPGGRRARFRFTSDRKSVV